MNGMNNFGAPLRPDFVVGIDFGMTCTGVAYANLTRGDIVRNILRWPGRAQANENKVPTLLSYSRENHSLQTWGFGADQRGEHTNPDREIVDWFKVYLDDGVLSMMRKHDPINTPKSAAEVERWFEDYLRELCMHIESRLSAELPVNKTWASSMVEFVFSVPTTWPPPTVERFRSIVSRAGYGKNPSHSITVGLTEAEAAAVSTSVDAPGMFRENDIVLVCDVGGGTTDLGVLAVQNVGSSAISLRQVDVVQGRNIGSVKIDEDFEGYARDKLEKANAALPLGVDPEDAAWHMMKSREYQNAKCESGSRDDTPVFRVPITGLNPDYVNESHGISSAHMTFKQSELRALFDVQVNRLFELIDKQLSGFQTKNPQGVISHLILSGGLGNSAYVQSKLETRYAFGLSTFACARTIQVHVAPEPQLCVCRGLVQDRIRRLSSGVGVLGWRCSRASYGTICKMPYEAGNPSHAGRQITKDPYTGKLYLINAIEWFIYKGQPVNSDTPITRPFTRKLEPGELNRTFPTSVVTSDVDVLNLPLQLNNDAQILCKIVSDLSMIHEARFKLKNRHWWSIGRPYRRCNYDVKVVIGPADVNFELWFEGGKLSKDNPVPVQWQASTAPPPVNPMDGEARILPAIARSRRVGLPHGRPVEDPTLRAQGVPAVPAVPGVARVPVAQPLPNYFNAQVPQELPGYFSPNGNGPPPVPGVQAQNYFNPPGTAYT